MKKNVLALSIAAMIGGLGFAGLASADVVVGTGAPGADGVYVADRTLLTATNATALSVSQGGAGHSLVVPYFNAQNGNMTVLHVVNTDTVHGKLAKVRFRSAANSDDILDFQVFLSPGDVWTAAVTAGASGVAELTTADGTCTLPKLNKGVSQPFVTDRLSDKVGNIANQTREGYVEIFNMADIDASKIYGATNNANSTLYTAIKHVNGTAPCTQAALDATLVNLSTQANVRALGLDTPTSGLMGDWYIINVAQSTTFAGAATSLLATVGAGGAAGRGNFVHFPQNATAAPTPESFTSDPLFRVAFTRDNANAAVTTAALRAANYDLPDLSTPYTAVAGVAVDTRVQAFNLTQALAVTSITNQYANDASISAKTDWVFSMPTRRYSVAANYAATATTAAGYRLYTTLTDAANFPGANPAVAASYKVWFAPENTTTEGGLICVNSTGQSFWDREEQSRTSGAVFSPGSVSQTRFCGETSVLSFADTGNSVLAASVARQNVAAGAASGPFTNGWSVVSTANSFTSTLGAGNATTGLGAANATVYNSQAGLPILGASFIKLTNPQAAAGTVGTYGITWPHRFTK
ncbi:cell surface protein [Acidovorax sp. HMWF029]|uniref:cell surface protein n=1 Tax=Acidovorax sp. HMWF029 TaxID=2056863 RepID=UPI000D33642D|nr:cell surface protein [Acidovorax sp. HMWF029]PTT16080.1 cell surface protein [Acidovorax sp. HMWF029]